MSTLNVNEINGATASGVGIVILSGSIDATTIGATTPSTVQATDFISEDGSTGLSWTFNRANGAAWNIVFKDGLMVGHSQS